MKKTRNQRRVILDRIEKKYKEKLELLDYKRESELQSQQLRAMRGMNVDQINEEGEELLELPRYRFNSL